MVDQSEKKVGAMRMILAYARSLSFRGFNYQ